MKTLDLDTAIKEILQATRDEDAERPFVFVVGAGLASPSVPLSRDIVDHCRVRAGAGPDDPSPGGGSPLDAYSYWFERAYPHPRQRQKYLRTLIESKAISSASLRLAHVLMDGRVANTVITPNFDDFVSRALTLFGRAHVVCDHPATVGRIDAETHDIQIVHVHGSYWFYDCCNLREEIQRRAVDPTESLTMSSLLDELFARRSPIVVGYAGWEDDVIMGALRRRLGRMLPYNLYWFCHTADEAERLPSWLKLHGQVRTIVESKEGEKRESRSESSLAQGVVEKTAAGRLLGQRVIDRLIQMLNLDAPELTREPLEFFARSLRATLIAGDLQDGSADIYGIREVIARVEAAVQAVANAGAVKAATLPTQSLRAREDSAAAAQLASFRDAIRRSQYREAITIGSAIERKNLSDDDLFELMSGTWTAARSLLDDSNEELLGYTNVIALGDALLAAQTTHRDVVQMLAKALLYKGLTFGNLNRNDDAVKVYDDLVQRFGESKEAALREQVSKALRNRGLCLYALSQSEAAIASYDEVVRRFGSASEPPLRDQVAKALVNKGFSLGMLNRNEEAITTYNDVAQRFGGAPEASLREQVAMALTNKGFSLGTLNRNDEAIATYEEVVRQFSDASEPALREQVAKALVNRGFSLGKLNRSEEAIATYDDVLRRFGDATEPALKELVGRALVNRGARLGVLNRTDDSLASYDEVVRRFGDAPEAGLREKVARALLNKGAKLGALNRRDHAIAAYDDVIRRFGDASDASLTQIVSEARQYRDTLLEAKA